MSRLSRMRLSGIRSFGCEPNDEQEIKFTSPVTLFLGQNGCGKTTVIEAIKFALTGDLPGGTRGGQGFLFDPQMANKVETRGQVKLKFYDIKGEPWTIVKVAKVKQNRDKLTYSLIDSTLSHEEIILSGRCCDIHKEIATHIGVPPAIINFALFCHQEDSYWPLEEPKKLKERFDAIFDSAKYNKCIENIIQLRKKKQTALKTLQIKVEYAEQNKLKMEEKREQLLSKEERLRDFKEKLNEIEASRKVVQTEFNEVITLEKDINSLSTEVELIRNNLSNLEEQVQEILSNCKEMKCSDEELNEKISKFESDKKDIQQNIDELEQKIKQVEMEEKKFQGQISEKQTQLGQLQAQKNENENKIQTRNRKIDEMSSILKIEKSIDKTTAIKQINKLVEKTESDLQNFREESDQREKQLQDEIDSCRTDFVKLKQSVTSKEKQVEEYKKELKQLSLKLSELDMCDSELNHIESRLKRIDKEISEEESQINVETVEDEIEKNKSKCKSLEEQQKKIDDEIQQLNIYSSTQTEIDLKTENLLKQQNDMQKLKLKHNEVFNNIFDNNIPESNLKTALTVYLDKQNKLIKEKNIQVTNTQCKVTSLETSLNFEKEKLKKMQIQLKNDNQTLNETIKNDTFENVETEMARKIQEKQNQRSILNSSKHIYTKYISNFKSSKPCCPICQRDVPEKDLTMKIVTDLENRITTIPERIQKTEQELNELNKEYNKIINLKPVYNKVEEVTKNEIPTLIKKIESLESELNDKLRDLKTYQYEIETLQKNQTLANNLMSDVTLIDRHQKEIKKMNDELYTLKSRIPKNVSTRNKQDLLSEQEDFKSMISSTRLTIENLTDKLNKHTKRLHSLKDQKNDLKTKELNIKKDLQGKDQFATKQEETEIKISFIESEIMEDKSEIQPKETKLNELIKTKEDNKKSDKKIINERTNQLNKLKQLLHEINSLQELITIFTNKNVDQKIDDVTSSIQNYQLEIKKCIDLKNNITKQSNDYKDQLNNRKNYYQELQNNIKLREKRKKIIELKANLEVCENKLGEHDITTIARRKIQLNRKILDYNQDESKISGQKIEQENIIKELKAELQQPNYANAASNYKKIFLEYKVLERVIEDLADFAKGIDWAMVQYHKQQMVMINQNIRDLWRSVYRGNDIDYIELKTEMDPRASTTNKRMYNYRLVQVKNDVELEMRGRCSAGQKVLASLIIRIALADTFSTKCGILALDEPTTNLDKENITSLCSVLCDLINEKRKQKNFQLLIITHDQEFLASLCRTVSIDDYNLISRNPEGKSVVTRCESDF